MPTYEYRCKDCGASLEVVQSFSEPSLTECRTCGGRLRKVFGNVGISFKGSGFYRTDSRSGSSSEAKDRDGKESSVKEPAGSSKESANGSGKESKAGSEKSEKKSTSESSGSKKSEAKSSK